MSQFIVDARPYVEIAYFLSGTALVFGLLFAYRQLTLIKEDMLIRSMRASKEKALEACSLYLGEYVIKANAFFHVRREANLDAYKGPIGDFTAKSVPKQYVSASVSQVIISEALACLNDLEMISALFTSGVADEETGFKVIGRTFCSSVEANYAIIAYCRQDNAQAYWTNIVSLYQLWRPRLTKVELQFAAKELEQRMINLDQMEQSACATRT